MHRVSLSVHFLYSFTYLLRLILPMASVSCAGTFHALHSKGLTATLRRSYIDLTYILTIQMIIVSLTRVCRSSSVYFRQRRSIFFREDTMTFVRLRRLCTTNEAPLFIKFLFLLFLYYLFFPRISFLPLFSSSICRKNIVARANIEWNSSDTFYGVSS